MAGRINDVSTDVTSYAINTLKEAKEKKAQAAFFSVLDSAVKAGQGSEKKVPGESVTGSKENELAASESMPEKEISDQAAKDSTSVKNVKDTKQTKESGSKVQDDTSKTDMEKAEEVVDAVCEELGLTKEELFQQFEQFADAIAALLMEQFDVSRQQIDVVLETLGLEVTDLLDTKNLMEAVVMLTGAEDISAVLTDENLYGQIQEVMGDMEALLQEGMEKTPMRAETLQTLEKSIRILDADVDVNVPETPEIENVSQKVQPREHADIQTADTPDENLLPVMEIETDKPEEHTSQSGQQNLSGQQAFTQFTSRLAEHVVQADGEMPVTTFAQAEQMEAIMRQVTDNVRLQVQADTTSLEMQLHPESYGKLNLHVSVREGVVTAQLAVENEMVRQALETQVVQLREEMEERGLVVDAVEVTIASHEFERNLEQDRQTGEGQQANEGSRRNIDLNNENLSLEEIMEMSEAESLARKMMLENGNTVDYSV